MGRPPCCDKEGIKKGPWTPEEDIILVSYIQQHGPSNWRSVPLNTGLLRCSKSCRLRWTNYLRPGIKRGNFTPHEEGIIIHLQALLGNKWAAIASYLPQRTDNDIKNYWNTHLKKKLKKLQSALGPHGVVNVESSPPSSSRSFSFEKRSSTQSGGGGYASSADNISRLLETWMGPSSKTSHKSSRPDQESTSCFDLFYNPKTEQECVNLMSRQEFDSMLSLDNINDVTWDKSSCDSGFTDKYEEERDGDKVLDIEKWLYDESGGQMMELDPVP